jgi:transposase
MTQAEEIILLREEIELLRQIILKQAQRMTELEDQLRKALVTKNSSNSSKPPSTDISRPNHNVSLREQSGKNSGGQPGHKGTTLRMKENPDKIVELKPDYCNECGCNLENVESQFLSKRQVTDIPPVTPIVTEYRNYERCCPKCGHHQKSSFPAGVNSHIQYGENIEAAVAYLSVYQYMPFKRMQEFFKDYFNLEISQGSIDNILKQMGEKAMPVYNRIKEDVMKSEQLGSDETSVKVNGKNFWAWVWQTFQSTYIAVSESRGSKTIDTLFPDGFKNSILSSDRWPAQLKTQAKGYQICLAHLQRDLKLLKELEDDQWSYAMAELLKEALYLKDENPEYSRNDPRILQLEENLDALLKEEIPKTNLPKTHALWKSLAKHRDSILTFLYYKFIAPDNNASERAIRNVKVKQKVSGQFKSNENIFCILRSVIDTCKKRGVDIIFTLNAIAQYVPAE